jgi:hypothetical protein
MMDTTQAQALAAKLRSMAALTETQRLEMARGLDDLVGALARVAELEAAYAGMMTRREVLERIVAHDGYGEAERHAHAPQLCAACDGRDADGVLCEHYTEGLLARIEELEAEVARMREVVLVRAYALDWLVEHKGNPDEWKRQALAAGRREYADRANREDRGA